MVEDLYMHDYILTNFFYYHYKWLVPWNDIKIVREGWYLKFLQNFNPNKVGACWLWKKPWEIHISDKINEWGYDVLLAHELTHVWQRVRGGIFFPDEAEAKRIANQYWTQKKEIYDIGIVAYRQKYGIEIDLKEYYKKNPNGQSMKI